MAKYLLAGADVVMTASSLLRHGPAQAGVLLDGLSDWMKRKGLATLADVRGQLSVPIGSRTRPRTSAEATWASLQQANSGAYGPW